MQSTTASSATDDLPTIDAGAFSGRLPAFLTEKVVGQPVPAALRQTLLTGGTKTAKKTVGLKGWRLEVVVPPVGNGYGYTIYAQ